MGAAAPEIYRLSRILTVEQFQGSFLYILVSVASIALGGVFASVWDEDHPIKCIYLGATFPFWISAWTHMQMH